MAVLPFELIAGRSIERQIVRSHVTDGVDKEAILLAVPGIKSQTSLCAGTPSTRVDTILSTRLRSPETIYQCGTTFTHGCEGW
jgi:hypothetical protein